MLGNHWSLRGALRGSIRGSTPGSIRGSIASGDLEHLIDARDYLFSHIVIYMLYEFTLTLRPALYRLRPEEQASRVRLILREVFKASRCKASAVFELTRENNIHIHAVVDLSDHKHRNRLFNKLRPHNAIFGRKTCEQLMHYPEYVEYIRKDLKLTQELIGDPVVQDDFELLGVLTSPNAFYNNIGGGVS